MVVKAAVNGETFGSKMNGRHKPPIHFICKVSPSRVLPQQVARSTPSPQSLRDSSPQAGEQFKVTPRGLRKSKTRQWAHFSPRTQWRHIVAPLMCAGNTPSPQSLRDSSPQAGEQFKVTPCGGSFFKGQKAAVPKGGVLVENCGRILEILRCAQYDTAKNDTAKNDTARRDQRQ